MILHNNTLEQELIKEKPFLNDAPREYGVSE